MYIWVYLDLSRVLRFISLFKRPDIFCSVAALLLDFGFIY